MTTKSTIEPRYVDSPAALKQWFDRHAASATVLVVGFPKTRTGAPGITWPQAMDEALCVGWIDGVRHRIDDARYKIRCTPRQPGSHWSDVNIRRVPELLAQGRMTPAGLAAFERRSEARSRRAYHDQSASPTLSEAQVAVSQQQQPTAWAFNQAASPTYQLQTTWWVISPQQAATRERRLQKLIDACGEGRRR